MNPFEEGAIICLEECAKTIKGSPEYPDELMAVGSFVEFLESMAQKLRSKRDDHI